MSVVSALLEKREDNWKIITLSVKVSEFNAVIIAKVHNKLDGSDEQRSITLTDRQIEITHQLVLKMKANAGK